MKRCAKIFLVPAVIINFGIFDRRTINPLSKTLRAINTRTTRSYIKFTLIFTCFKCTRCTLEPCISTACKINVTCCARFLILKSRHYSVSRSAKEVLGSRCSRRTLRRTRDKIQKELPTRWSASRWNLLLFVIRPRRQQHCPRNANPETSPIILAALHAPTVKRHKFVNAGEFIIRLKLDNRHDLAIYSESCYVPLAIRADQNIRGVSRRDATTLRAQLASRRSASMAK